MWLRSLHMQMMGILELLIRLINSYGRSKVRVRQASICIYDATKCCWAQNRIKLPITIEYFYS